ncbi:MAG TPA: selenium-binding protein SBP56-related protein [Chloroflexota bacterium]|nr:selenium-binding protein SBP56-related protein [Chloroflexota bacterium]
MSETQHNGHKVGYASPAEAIQAPREEFVYVACLHEGTGLNEPDFLAVVDVNPQSDTYQQITHRLSMPNVGDELHHYGWQVCSSACHSNLERANLIVPGFRSSRIHIVDVASDPRKPRIHKVIEPEEVIKKTGYTAPHTVHCMPGGIVTISMLGDANGDAPGGFAVLDASTFEVLGRWEHDKGDLEFTYDFWYQPRKGFMVSSEWGAPNTFRPGFNLEDVQAGKYGHKIHIWDLEQRALRQSIDLGETGMIPLEVRWLHNPEAEEGYVAAALSSTLWHIHRQNGGWTADQVVAVEGKEVSGWPFPVPGLITDQIISMDDKFLYFSDWLHGDLRQYDISDPAHPRLTGQVWCGGVLGPVMHGSNGNRRELSGGPQMLQLSMDGRRLYVTNSLYSTWDNQFYPNLKSWMLKIDCDPNGGMAIDPNFYVDFSPARGHEIHLPAGDCTTEIFA